MRHSVAATYLGFAQGVEPSFMTEMHAATTSISFDPFKQKNMRKSIDSLPGMKRYRRDVLQEMPQRAAGLHASKRSVKE